jgi:hypothetical protein
MFSSSIVIEHIKQLKEQVYHCYCLRDTAQPERAEPKEILSVILKQLASANVFRGNRLGSLYREKLHDAKEDGSPPERLSVTECVECILAFTSRIPAIIIIDGLDECREEVRHELMSALDRIAKESVCPVKIFVSSRDDIDIVLELRKSPNIYISALKNGGDIQRFILEQIERAIKERRLLRGNVSTDLKELIIMELVARAHGMYVSCYGYLDRH